MIKDWGDITECKRGSKEFTTNVTKQQLPNIINAIDLGMVDFKNTDDVIRPSSNRSDYYEDDDTWNQPESIEDSRDR